MSPRRVAASEGWATGRTRQKLGWCIRLELIGSDARELAVSMRTLRASRGGGVRPARLCEPQESVQSVNREEGSGC